MAHCAPWTVRFRPGSPGAGRGTTRPRALRGTYSERLTVGARRVVRAARVAVRNRPWTRIADPYHRNPFATMRSRLAALIAIASVATVSARGGGPLAEERWRHRVLLPYVPGPGVSALASAMLPITP